MLDYWAHEALRNPDAVVDEDQDFDASVREFLSEQDETLPNDFEDA
jgi:hypothetical protein